MARAEVEPPLAAAYPSAEEQQQEAERRAAVQEAIDALDPIFRDVLVAVELDERPMPDVAADLGIPENTGWNRLHIARARFAEAVRRILARRRLQPGDI